jgi:hypothetical protein
MGYGGGGGGGGGSGGGGGGGSGGSGSGAGGSSGYRRVGDDRTANLKVDNITSRNENVGTEVDGIVEVNTTAHFIPPSGSTGQRYADGGENIVRNGLILYMDAKYSYDANWYDMSGNDYYAEPANTSGGNPTYSKSNGGYLNFAGGGTDQRFEILNSFQVRLGQRYTVEAWIYKETTATSNAASIISGGFGGDRDGLMITTETYSDDVSKGFLKNETESSTVDDPNVIMYFNGVPQPKDPSDGRGTSTFYNLNEWVHVTISGAKVISTDGGRHFIGCNNNNSNDFDGRIAVMKVYDRSLSAEEVLQNYNALKTRFI